MVQWVRNLTVVAQVTVVVVVQYPNQHSGLKDLVCGSHSLHGPCGLDSIPSLGTSICCGCGQKFFLKRKIKLQNICLKNILKIHLSEE